MRIENYCVGFADGLEKWTGVSLRGRLERCDGYFQFNWGVVWIEYRDYGTKKRTLLRPVVTVGRDLQSLPPWGWCERCGKEVYRKQEVLCDKCNLKMQNAECKMQNECVGGADRLKMGVRIPRIRSE